MNSKARAALSFAALMAACAVGGQVRADEAATPVVDLAITYTADVQGVVSGAPRAGRYLDNLDVVVDVDLERAVGWRGGALHAYGLSNMGGRPNDLAGTLQGTDNIEVATPHVRLFELWAQQQVGPRASVLAGLYNINSEFYANDSAALLVAPPFGIGSELAATGPNGPSIFPSTALALRLNVDLGRGAYARAAALNAHSGVLGDPGGVDFSFDDGALLIAEAGVEGPVRLGAGAWTYTERQDDIRDTDSVGDPVRRKARGAYLLGERRLFGEDGARTATAFFRVGVSDGDTTPFTGGWQAGILVERPFAGRPDSAVSFGVQQGRLGAKYRDNQHDAGLATASAETGLELTYSDRLLPRLTIQPDLQWIHNPGGDAQAADVWVAGLRIKVDLSPGRP